MNLLQKQDVSPLPGTANTYDVNLARDPHARKVFNELTSENLDEANAHTEVEQVLGSVHISKPSIQHVFFLLRPIMKPILEQFSRVEHELNELVTLMKLERVFLDKPTIISTNIPYTVDYKGRKFLYLLCYQALSIVVNGNILATVPGKWFMISFPAGTAIYGSAVSDASPMPVTIRACDQFGYDQ